VALNVFLLVFLLWTINSFKYSRNALFDISSHISRGFLLRSSSFATFFFFYVFLANGLELGLTATGLFFAVFALIFSAALSQVLILVWQ